jgi:hypothetical protein
MDNYERFVKYKRWCKAKRCVVINVIGDGMWEPFDCDEAVHTLELRIKSSNVKIPIANISKLFEVLLTKVKFIRRLVLNGFSTYVHGPNFSDVIREFFKTVLIKNIIFKNSGYFDMNAIITHSNIPNINFESTEMVYCNFGMPINNIKNININGLGEFSKKIRIKHYKRLIHDILQRVAKNRKEYNAHMASIRYVYLSRHYGLFSILPTNIIDYIISKIYL